MTTSKNAGITVYLMEELTDARLRCDQLKRQINQVVQLVSQSKEKAHVYEVAGDLIYGVPNTLFLLDKALDATALAASRLDYEELKQDLSPEKVKELEEALKDVRIHQFDRKGPDMGKQAVQSMDVGKWYKQDLKGAVVYFNSLKKQANGGLAGVMYHPTSRNKVTKTSINKMEFKLWDEVKESDVPEEIVKKVKAKTASTLRVSTGSDVASLLRQIAAAIESDEARGISPSSSKIANTLGDVVSALVGDTVAEEVHSKFEEGKPADPTENMSDEDAKKWRVEHLKNKDNFKAANPEEHVSRFEEGKPADPTENMSEDDAAKWRVEHLKNKDNFKESRFETGKPADPTQNMSPEDASKWKDMNDEHKDKFKTASPKARSHAEILKVLGETTDKILDARVQGRRGQDLLQDVLEDAMGISGYAGYQDPELRKAKNFIYDLDRQMGSVIGQLDKIVRMIKNNPRK